MSDRQGQLSDMGIRLRARDFLLFLGILVAVVLSVFAANGLLTRLRSKEAATPLKPAVVEAIDGTDLKRVTLTEKAAERLALQVTQVREIEAARNRAVGAQVVASPVIPITGESGSAGESRLLVRVGLTESDLSQVDRSQAARVRPLDDDDEDDDLEAEPAEALGGDDAEDDDLDEGVLYYVIIGSDAGLEAGQRVFVELPLLGSGALRKVVPYSALIYDVKGATWVYTKEPNALTFVRHSITVDYIEGDLAFLTDGPPTGTQVVTVGGAELYGAETGVSK